jgi:hypothetical protein
MTLIIDYHYLFSFIDTNRKSFYTLLELYSKGQVPDNPHLRSIYFLIIQTKCCGFDDNKNMTRRERIFFERLAFSSNCPMDMPGPPYP